MALRRSGESAAALAFPPFFPPSLPRATAAGFFRFLGFLVGVARGAVWPVAAPTTAAASWFGSRGMLDRFGMPGV